MTTTTTKENKMTTLKQILESNQDLKYNDGAVTWDGDALLDAMMFSDDLDRQAVWDGDNVRLIGVDGYIIQGQPLFKVVR